MASKDRERRLERERRKRQQERRTAQATRRRQRAAVVAAVGSVLVVVGGIFLVANLVGDDDPAAAPDAPPTADATPTADAPPPATPAAEPCPPAPQPQPEAPSFPAPADQALAPGTAYTATLATNCGDVVVELLAEEAPETVNSFVFLAREGFYDATPCHRLTTGGLAVLQCGDPTGSGTGGPGYTVPLENAPADEVYSAGTVAMARAQDPGSGGSQFFLVYEESTLPAPGYTVFGRVTEGLDIVTDVAAAGDDGSNGPGDGAPNQPIGIESLTVSDQGAPS